MTKDSLALFEADPEMFLPQFVTMDETWVYHFCLETKESQNSGSTFGTTDLVPNILKF